MTCRQQLETLFQKRKVRFTITKHTEVYSAQRVAREVGIPGRELAKVVIVAGDGELVMMVLPAPHRLSLAKARKVLKARRVRLAEEEDFADLFPDCELGAMPPFGDLYDLPLYVDRTLTTQREIAFNAGTHDEIMHISFTDYERVARPTIASFGER
jgi:Ala-tRNA(Pro) deacylase